MTDTLGRRLQDVRLRADLTQEAVAEKAGLSVYSVRNWEQDLREPGALALYRLTRALGVSMDTLLEGLEGSNTVQAPEKARGKKRGGA
jgi:transcriptional regulator with XRE-family HTH domain